MSGSIHSSIPSHNWFRQLSAVLARSYSGLLNLFIIFIITAVIKSNLIISSLGYIIVKLRRSFILRIMILRIIKRSIIILFF